MNAWALPTTARFGGRAYALNTDYRDVMGIFAWLNGEAGQELSVGERWYVALNLFYRDFAAMPKEQYAAATEYLNDFLSAGRAPEPGGSAQKAPRLIDWEQDAPMIAAGVNKVAGCDIRAMPYVHWWTFRAWYDAMGEGTLSTVVGIREKLHRGKRLEGWELEYYRTHRAEIELRPRITQAERAERARLNALLK